MKTKKEDILFKKLFIMIDGCDHNELMAHLLNTISMIYERLSLDNVEEDKQERAIEDYFNLIAIHLKNVKEELTNLVTWQKQ